MRSRCHGLIIILTMLIVSGSVIAVERPDAEDPISLLQSPDVEVRREALQSIAKEHLRVVEGLLAILRSPRAEEGDGWLDEESPRNLAIRMLGQFREDGVLALDLLIGHLERPEGEPEPMVIDHPFHTCPAARAFISIGQPSTKPMIEILATTEDVKRMRANQARLILYYVEGPAEGERLLTEAVEAEQDPERQKTLQANLEAFKVVRK